MQIEELLQVLLSQGATQTAAFCVSEMFPAGQGRHTRSVEVVGWLATYCPGLQFVTGTQAVRPALEKDEPRTHAVQLSKSKADVTVPAAQTWQERLAEAGFDTKKPGPHTPGASHVERERMVISSNDSSSPVGHTNVAGGFWQMRVPVHVKKDSDLRSAQREKVRAFSNPNGLYCKRSCWREVRLKK